VQRVCALVAVGVLCATGPAARAQEKPATAGTEKPAATTDVERLLALPWADMREKVTRHPHARPWRARDHRPGHPRSGAQAKRPDGDPQELPV